MEDRQFKAIAKLLLELKSNSIELKKEVRALKRQINESVNIPPTKLNSSKTLTETVKPEPVKTTESHPAKTLMQNSKSPLAEIFSDLTPFDENETPVSILDESVNLADNDPGTTILNKIKNTDYRKFMAAMEKSTNRNMHI